MVGTSNDGIMTECLVSFGAIKASPQPSRKKLLQILHIADAYRAGRDLAAARLPYDATQWDDLSAKELDRRLADLDRFMSALARDRLQTWGIAAATS
jgi:hypothetical protein